MTPPRTTTAEPDPGVAYDRIVARVAEVQGIINIAEAELVSLTRQAIEVGVSGGTALTVQAWVAWRTGMAPERAYSITRLAERADELPSTIAALDAGELTIDQAGEIARNVPGRYEASASRVARHATVRQLRRTLPSYRDRTPTDDSPRKERREMSTGIDEHGCGPACGSPKPKAPSSTKPSPPPTTTYAAKPDPTPPTGRHPSPSPAPTPSSHSRRQRCVRGKPPDPAPSATSCTSTSKPAPTAPS